MRIKKGLPLVPYERETFYAALDPQGYADYGFADAECEGRYRAWKDDQTQTKRQGEAQSSLS